jgi:hypothetical protein
VAETSETLPDRRVVVTALGVHADLCVGLHVLSACGAGAVIARDTGWSYDRVVLGVSVAMLVAGIVSPRVGHLISTHGGRPVLGIGALLLAAGLAAIRARAETFPSILPRGRSSASCMGAGLYDAAFSTLGNIYGSNARGAITSVTLFGGFASTVCWPLSACWCTLSAGARRASSMRRSRSPSRFPLHLLALPRGDARAASGRRSGQGRRFACSPANRPRSQSSPVVITIGAAILSTVGTHLLPLLAGARPRAGRRGRARHDRRAGAGRRARRRDARRPPLSPVWTMIASAVLVAISAVMLFSRLSDRGAARSSSTAPATASARSHAARCRSRCSARNVIRC